MSNLAFVNGADTTAATLTILGQTGKYIAIHALRIGRAGAAVLVGSKVLVITSTNISDGAGNTCAWAIGDASIVGGTANDYNMTFPEPLYSDLPGVNVTIVMPDPGDGVLWSTQVCYSHVDKRI